MKKITIRVEDEEFLALDLLRSRSGTKFQGLCLALLREWAYRWHDPKLNGFPPSLMWNEPYTSTDPIPKNIGHNSQVNDMANLSHAEKNSDTLLNSAAGEAEQGVDPWEAVLLDFLREILRSGNEVAIRAISENLKAFRALSLGLSHEKAREFADIYSTIESAHRLNREAKDAIKAGIDSLAKGAQGASPENKRGRAGNRPHGKGRVA